MGYFFRARPHKTEDDAQKLLVEAFQKLQAYQYVINWQPVINQLKEKQLVIRQQIAQADNQTTKEKLICSYFLFAETLTGCIDTPAEQQTLVRNYHKSPDYYHIGGEKGQYSYTFMDNVMTKLTQMSTTMLVCSLIALPFDLTAGLILLGIAIFILAPALFYVIAETNANKLEVQQEERALFATVTALVHPVPTGDKVSADGQQASMPFMG
ncbi:hypothetical protein [Legionella sp. 29fVS95]|uniref:hypothetical protein n=1 Tax=Legionella sp. 29fVS95 TaxID=3402813 RepID=UPI003AF9FD42